MKQERRDAGRTNLRIPISYEVKLKDGSFDEPMAAVAGDISMRGVSFYTQEKIDINTTVRINLAVSEEKSVSFLTKVVRVLLTGQETEKYSVGVAVERINEEKIEILSDFLKKYDVDKILGEIDLTDVMDIHFVVGFSTIVKRSGSLELLEGKPFDRVTLKGLLLSCLDIQAYEKFMQEKEANFIYTQSKGQRFRVNLHCQRGNIEGVFRVIPSKVATFESLGIPSVVETILKESDRGLIIVDGRTGSGKTTTLSAMVEYFNRHRKAIVVCIENPIEYLHTNSKCIIKQREVGKDTLSFNNAVKNALRQNPDILVIGEILDRDTLELAIAAAESGTLVITSMHASDTVQCLDRVASLFPAEMQTHILRRLALILKGVITQDLLLRLDNKGLVLASEILVSTLPLRNAIRKAEWNKIPDIIQTGKKLGMRSMEDSIKELYESSLIHHEYVRGYID